MNYKKYSKESIVCPICGQGTFEEEYDICKVCFWENDSYQLANPDENGMSNNLSLNDYKIWWAALEKIMPAIQKKYHIKPDKKALWKYDNMIVPRENIIGFINEMTQYNIELLASYYFLCEQYIYDDYTFVGYPLIAAKSVKENNDEIINVIFSKKPIEVGQRYQMKQVVEILQKSDNPLKTWEQLTPHICIMPNPKFLPTYNI